MAMQAASLFFLARRTSLAIPPLDEPITSRVGINRVGLQDRSAVLTTLKAYHPPPVPPKYAEAHSNQSAATQQFSASLYCTTPSANNSWGCPSSPFFRAAPDSGKITHGFRPALETTPMIPGSEVAILSRVI